MSENKMEAAIKDAAVLVGNGSALIEVQKEAVRANLCSDCQDASCKACRATIRGVNRGFTAGWNASRQWIPVSDRLPLKEGLYLATFEDDDESGVIPVYLSFDDQTQKPRFYTYDAHLADPGNIIAWCELPEPYQPADETAKGEENDE